MTEYMVNARHQIERGGRMFAPRQIVPGVNPDKNKEDALMVKQGLLTEVKKAPTKGTSKSSSSKGESSGTQNNPPSPELGTTAPGPDAPNDKKE